MEQAIQNGATSLEEAEARELAALEAELAEQQKRREAAEARREGATKAAQLRQKIEAEKRSAAEAEILADLEDKYGKVGDKLAYFSTPEGLLVVRAPSLVEWKKFRTRSRGKDGATLEDQEEFVLRVLVHPERAVYQKIRDERPGIIDTLLQQAAKLGGMRSIDLEGK